MPRSCPGGWAQLELTDALFGGWMFNRSCSVDFLVRHLIALGGFSYAQSTVSYVIYCLGKGSWQVTILRITTVKNRPV